MLFPDLANKIVREVRRLITENIIIINIQGFIIASTDAATIVTANPGCLLQMKLGIEHEKLSHKMRGIHIVDLLLEAIETNS
ncbi:sugar diacid recognition domain-containing protein [Bacillus sp. H1a]|uniref:sugar diacid recognition domain-containing protein n=1 Tax=Bacillus sp. H1a TaxID=1397276 RepID=UPI00046A70AD|nr:sugar diacid recognition domain-containing protein [Bacillus sp. H1a]